MKKTALYEYHIENQAKMVEFAGYLLPIQYPTGVLKEHAIVREEVGLFDVSHMGKIWVFLIINNPPLLYKDFNIKYF